MFKIQSFRRLGKLEADDILSFFLLEKMSWHFMLLVCSHEMSQLIFFENKIIIIIIIIMIIIIIIIIKYFRMPSTAVLIGALRMKTLLVSSESVQKFRIITVLAASESTQSVPGFKFNFFDSLLKLANGIFYLLNLSANLLFHTYKHW